MLEIKHECENCKHEPETCLCKEHLAEILDEANKEGYNEGYNKGLIEGQNNN